MKKIDQNKIDSTSFDMLDLCLLQSLLLVRNLSWIMLKVALLFPLFIWNQTSALIYLLGSLVAKIGHHNRGMHLINLGLLDKAIEELTCLEGIIETGSTKNSHFANVINLILGDNIQSHMVSEYFCLEPVQNLKTKYPPQKIQSDANEQYNAFPCKF